MSAVAQWPTDQFLASRARLQLTLSRPLNTPGERIGVVVGDVDVSAIVEIDGRHITFTPERIRLPAGATEVVVFLVRSGSMWEEIARAALRVRTRVGFDQQHYRPSVELSSTGPMARGDPADVAPDPRGAYQDATVRFGVDGEHVRDAWRITTQANAIAVTEPSQRLRFGELQQRAPGIDLADFRITAGGGAWGVSLGHQSTGQHRLLANGFGSRGLGGMVRVGPAVAFDGALLNGTSIAGWSNPLGMNDPRHRVASAGVSVEFVPSRPGAFMLHLAGVDGSLLARTNFVQSAATDVEQSRGGGVRVIMSDAAQRVRFEGGYARSRFTNPSDPLLDRGADVVAVRAETRSAYFAELAADVLRNVPLTSSLPTSLAIGARHERADPLYRSIATFVQPDRDASGADVTGTLGPLSVKSGLAVSRDNLQRVLSVLTTRTRQHTISASLPLGNRCNGTTCWLPNASYSRDRSRQFGEGVPIDGEFNASHVPDQVSLNHLASLGWTVRGLAMEYRWNASAQDNRQPGRENADFRTTVNALSVSGGSVGGADIGLDASRERQLNVEFNTTQRIDRLGGTVRWQPRRAADVLAVASHAWGANPAEGVRTRNMEFQIELSRGFNLYRRYDGGTQVRAWIRFARTRAAVLPTLPQPLLNARISWTLLAGGSFRLY